MARSKYSLLTIDGGGIRGIIPATVVHEIETRLRRPACELFDLISGTSTGGIIALGLTQPEPGERRPANAAEDLLQLYLEHGRELFPDSLLLKIRSLGGLADVRYPYQPLENLLKDRFKSTKLSEALTEVVVPSYDLSKPGPFFFKRAYTREDSAWDVEMWQTARATSAAPTYFEPAQLPAFKNEGDHALVDGGVFANNPSMAAFADAVDLWGLDAEVHVVSVGTGEPPQGDHPDHGGIPVPFDQAQHWGLARWAHPMLEVVFDGIAKAVEYQMTMVLRDSQTHHYHRLQGELVTASHAMDDASPENMQKLQADAKTLLERNAKEFDAVCETLENVAADRDAANSASPAGG